MLTKDQKIVPVSLWLRKLETEGRCLAVAETVERRVAQVCLKWNKDTLLLTDYCFAKVL
jgi:hypothetical protein